MPLFGHKHHDNSISTSDNPAGVGNGRLTGSHTQANSGHPSRNAPAGDSIGAPHRHQESAINTSQAYGGAGVPLGSDSSYQRAELGYGNQDTGVGTGPRAAQQALPPRTDASGNPAVPRSRGTLGSRMTGKAESALGSVVGSQSLKEKGLAKEREADALKAQAVELSEAERLEREAISRRERAVAHGALRHLGGHNPSI